MSWWRDRDRVTDWRETYRLAATEISGYSRDELVRDWLELKIENEIESYEFEEYLRDQCLVEVEDMFYDDSDLEKKALEIHNFGKDYFNQ